MWLGWQIEEGSLDTSLSEWGLKAGREVTATIGCESESVGADVSDTVDFVVIKSSCDAG